MIGSGQGANPERVRRLLERVMEREGLPELPAEAGPVERFLGGLFDDATLNAPISREHALLLGLLVALVLLAVWLRSRRAHRARRAQTGSGADEPLDPGLRHARALELVRAAHEARTAGDQELAARLYLFALVVRHGERGDLEFRAAWTDRELLERGRPRPELRERLAALLDELEPRTFGSQPVRATDVERLASACAELVGGAV